MLRNMAKKMDSTCFLSGFYHWLVNGWIIRFPAGGNDVMFNWYGFLHGFAKPKPQNEPGLDHFLFSIIYGIILPIDFHIFQDG